MTAALGGWVAAAIAGTICVLAWRAFLVRMEGVMRACHEVRGPLTAVRLGLSSYGRGAPLSADRVRAIDLELSQAALALDDLVELGSSSPRASRSNLAEIELRTLVDDCVEAWKGVAEENRVDLEVERSCSAPILADRFRLAQAIGNLIANAIEHGGDQVRVAAHSGTEGARVEVRDDGPGLPATLPQLIRGRDRGRRRAGRGRGLAIASAIAEAHGGSLCAAPSDRGTYLVLELPSGGRVAPAARRSKRLTAA